MIFLLMSSILFLRFLFYLPAYLSNLLYNR